MIRVTCLIGMLLVSVIGLGYGQQQNDSLLRQRVASIDVSATNVDATLISLAGKYSVPVGNEVSSQNSSESPASQLELKNSTVEEILKVLFGNHPDYWWQVTDGVLNVSSSSAFEPLLDTVIGEFDVKEQTVSEIKQALAERPEVQFILSQTNTEFQELTILPRANAEAPGKIYVFFAKRQCPANSKSSDLANWGALLDASEIGKQKTTLDNRTITKALGEIKKSFR